MIKDELKKLNETDIYSLSMFLLYNLTEVPEYCTLSELPYLINREDLLTLCSYYGGMTIKIPTLEELQGVMKAILVYQENSINKKSLSEVATLFGYDLKDTSFMKIYKKLCEVLTKYEFKSRSENK